MEEKIVTILNEMAEYLNSATDEKITGSNSEEHFQRMNREKQQIFE